MLKKSLLVLIAVSFLFAMMPAQQEEFLSEEAVKNTVEVDNFHDLWFKTTSGNWKKVPGTADTLADLKALGAATEFSQVLHRPTMEEPSKYIYALAPEAPARYITKTVKEKVSDATAKADQMFNAVDEKQTETRRETIVKPVGEKKLIVKVTKFTDEKRIKEEKWRYRTKTN